MLLVNLKISHTLHAVSRVLCYYLDLLWLSPTTKQQSHE